ncbi:DNA repair protein RadC [uncultured Oscillibacter sp.]|uniref:RadC family protein n=1 Tax=uncultured Oscillibacter sp. TaxID=876091 RepID=UPI002601E4BF|nr:DNA repair protein RadC [uncultured Oscillibacter sp.]
MGVHDGHRERVRRRFLENGLSGFADHEALELLLYYAIPQGNVNPLAHALMDRFGSLSAVLSAPVELLTEVKGVGERTAVLLRLTSQIARRARLSDLERELVLNSREQVGAYLLELFSNEPNEAVYQLCLDGKGKLLACKRLGEGSVSAVTVDVRKVVQNAIFHTASSVILAHNHPSGIALPSEDDHAVTARVRAALDAIGVRLEDHIIVADHDFVSFSESGYLM